jgi:NADH:ubiquinone oxidoreductase subunit 6 (subunit J)
MKRGVSTGVIVIYVVALLLLAFFGLAMLNFWLTGVDEVRFNRLKPNAAFFAIIALMAVVALRLAMHLRARNAARRAATEELGKTDD